MLFFMPFYHVEVGSRNPNWKRQSWSKCVIKCSFLCPILTWPSLLSCRFRWPKSYNTFRALSKSNLVPTTCLPEHLANIMLGWLEIICNFILNICGKIALVKWPDHSLTISTPLFILNCNAHVQLQICILCEMPSSVIICWGLIMGWQRASWTMRLYETYINVSFLKNYLEWGLGSFRNLKLPLDLCILSPHLTGENPVVFTDAASQRRSFWTVFFGGSSASVQKHTDQLGLGRNFVTCGKQPIGSSQWKV